MELNLNKIKEITTGAVRITEEDGAFVFCRFTKEQEELYKITNPDFYKKSFSTAGVKLLFKTNSKGLFLDIIADKGSSREYFSLDVFVDGEPVGYIDNYSDVEIPKDYTQLKLSHGEFSKTFRLGEGEKTVCVHLPWSAIAKIKQIAVDDGAFVEGVKPQKILLAYGDSITQGYDAMRPSNRYVAKLADELGAQEYNKAIGGERFFPELAQLIDSFVPDYITVAYGTNDWSGLDEETFKVKCRAFYKNLSENYPKAKIFAITPIWRKDMNMDKKFGAFSKVEEDIREIVADIDNITVISGFDFVTKDESYYADLRLHPNDKGFLDYAKNLWAQISKNI